LLSVSGRPGLSFSAAEKSLSTRMKPIYV